MLMEHTKVLNIWEKIGEDNQMDNEGPKSTGEEQFSHDQGEVMSMKVPKIFFGAQITSRFCMCQWAWLVLDTNVWPSVCNNSEWCK